MQGVVETTRAYDTSERQTLLTGRDEDYGAVNEGSAEGATTLLESDAETSQSSASRGYDSEETASYYDEVTSYSESEGEDSQSESNMALKVEVCGLSFGLAISVVLLAVGWDHEFTSSITLEQLRNLVAGILRNLVAGIFLNEQLRNFVAGIFLNEQLRNLVAGIFLNAFVTSGYAYLMLIVYLCKIQNHDDQAFARLLKDLKRDVLSWNWSALKENPLTQAVPIFIYFLLVLGCSREMLTHSQSLGKAMFSAFLVEAARCPLVFVNRPTDTIRAQAKELVEVKNSIATGLADAYFFSLLRKVLKIIEANDSRVPIKYSDKPEKLLAHEIYGSTPKSVELAEPFFFVAIPRRIYWGTSSDPDTRIGDIIDSILARDEVANYQIERGSVSADTGNFRPPTIMVDARRETTLLFDVPTILGKLTSKIAGDEKLTSDKERDEEYLKEVEGFKRRLWWRLHDANMEGMARIVVIGNEPPADFTTVFRRYVRVRGHGRENVIVERSSCLARSASAPELRTPMAA